MRPSLYPDYLRPAEYEADTNSVWIPPEFARSAVVRAGVAVPASVPINKILARYGHLRKIWGSLPEGTAGAVAPLLRHPELIDLRN